MNLILKRVAKNETYTIGHLYIEDEYFCDTLEDTVRDLRNGEVKVPDETAIPETLPGKPYEVEIIWWDKHKGYYPHIKDVPFFTSILIHSGNRDSHTSGCILVGKNTIKGRLTRSGYCFLGLMNKIKNEKNITIEIV
jgi:hypothetical protein